MIRRKIYLPPVVVLILIFSLAACRLSNTEAVRSIITAADSLLDTNPYAALDTLLSPDSVTVAGLHGKLRADYALLLAEAEYKCYSPLSDNEKDILRAVDWFRKHGPEEKHAGALMMKGAMLYEKGDAEAALQAYKTAEPILESIGDLERLGLLHTRIGELYGHSLVNNEESIERYKSAIACFDKAGKKERKMVLQNALAGKYMSADSLEAGFACAMQALDAARELQDTVELMYAHSLLAHYYSNIIPPDYAASIRTALDAVSLPGVSRSEDPVVIEERNTLFYILACGYVRNGKTDSAGYYMQGIAVTGEKTQFERFDLMSRIAGLEGDSTAYYRNRMKADSISYRMYIRGHEQKLRNAELQADNLLLREESMYIRNRLVVRTFLLIIMILSIIILVFAIRFLHRKMKKDRHRNTEIINTLKTGSLEKEQELSEARKLAASIQNKLKQSVTMQRKVQTVIGELLEMENRLVDTYYRYGSTPALQAEVKKIIDTYCFQTNPHDTIHDIVESAYPGYLQSLKDRYPTLTGNNLLIIAMIVCGFLPGTICAICGMNERSLSVAKTRIANKMGTDNSLMAFIAESLENHVDTGKKQC